MPALTIPSPTTTRSTSPTSSSAPSDRHDKHDSEPSRSRSRSRSTGRPPVSPLTPTVSVAQLAPIEPAEAQKHVLPPPLTTTFRPQPAAVPISESENPDAIALRSAISLLQLQREKSKRDLKTLEELKSAAVSDPHGFVRSMQEQRAKASKTPSDALAPTLADASGPDVETSTVDEEERNGNGRKDSGGIDSPPSEHRSKAKLPAIPQPQNIIRCPPVNWAKYHVVGESLDKMHEEQKRWPGSTEPPRTASGARAPPHSIAAPYSPFKDGVTGTQRATSHRGTKKSPS